MLVIADEKKPVAVAGVIGGLDSAVTDATRDIFIESACFDPGSVRRTRKALETLTDASYRFERGADISFAPRAAVMAASLMTPFGGKAAREPVDVHPRPRKPRELLLRARRVADLLGVEIKPAFIEKILGELGFGLKSRPIGSWMVQVPPHRIDVEREADLVEDVARFYGYDKIPVVVPPLEVVEPVPSPEEKIRRLSLRLFHFGFDEVINQSFTDPEKEAVLSGGQKAVGIRNPISIKVSVLRTTLLGSLLENTAWNRNRGMDGVHIFETSRVFGWADADETATVEHSALALSTTGPLDSARWSGKPEATDIFHLKGALESALESLRFDPLTYAPDAHPAFDAGFTTAVHFKGEKIGTLGRVKAGVLELYSLKGPVYAAEINLTHLFEKQVRPFEFAPLPKFPAVSRDLSLLVGRNVPYQDIRQAVLKMSPDYLERFDVIDRYAGETVPPDMVSLSLRFVYRNPKGTLTAEDVDKSEQKIIKGLKAAFAARLREGGSS
jgi:phenylalanyl-tRNA synthetase beta chain